MKLEDVQKAIDDWFDSPACEEYFEKEKIKDDILFNRFQKLENYLLTNPFENILGKVIQTDYLSKFDNSYSNVSNNILQFILDYLRNNFDMISVSQLDCDFENHIWFFKGYYFQTIFGQGSITRIYDDKFKLIFQT